MTRKRQAQQVLQDLSLYVYILYYENGVDQDTNQHVHIHM